MKFPNYNILANIPITNLVGTTTDPIDLDSLVDVGTYLISGDVTSADAGLVTEVDAFIASGDTFISVLDIGGTIYQYYHLLAPITVVVRAYPLGVWSAFGYANYIQDDGAGNVGISGKLNLGQFTVGTLPTGALGDTCYVTDALAPTYGATVIGGGAVAIPVFYDGSNWVCR